MWLHHGVLHQENAGVLAPWACADLWAALLTQASSHDTLQEAKSWSCRGDAQVAPMYSLPPTRSDSHLWMAVPSSRRVCVTIHHHEYGTPDALEGQRAEELERKNSGAPKR